MRKSKEVIFTVRDLDPLKQNVCEATAVYSLIGNSAIESDRHTVLITELHSKEKFVMVGILSKHTIGGFGLRSIKKHMSRSDLCSMNDGHIIRFLGSVFEGESISIVGFFVGFENINQRVQLEFRRVNIRRRIWDRWEQFSECTDADLDTRAFYDISQGWNQLCNNSRCEIVVLNELLNLKLSDEWNLGIRAVQNGFESLQGNGVRFWPQDNSSMTMNDRGQSAGLSECFQAVLVLKLIASDCKVPCQ